MEHRQNIQVICRVRPLNKGERKRSVKRVVKVVEAGDLEDNAVVNVALPKSGSSASKTSIPSVGLRGGKQKNAGVTTHKQYHPSLALAPGCTQQEVFERSNLRELVSHSMMGYRATMFAYGQTGAGKSYTVVGEDRKPGLLYRGVNYLFKECASDPNVKYTIRVSAIELYNEQCFDLLQTTTRARFTPLQVREHGENNLPNITSLMLVPIPLTPFAHRLPGILRGQTDGGEVPQRPAVPVLNSPRRLAADRRGAPDEREIFEVPSHGHPLR